MLTAATLVAELPELGQIDGKTATALAGLAPWSRDSGRQQSRRSIQGEGAAGLAGVLPGLARPRQTGQGSADGGDAEAYNTAERHRRPRHALGAETALGGRLKTA